MVGDPHSLPAPAGASSSVYPSRAAARAGYRKAP